MPKRFRRDPRHLLPSSHLSPFAETFLPACSSRGNFFFLSPSKTPEQMHRNASCCFFLLPPSSPSPLPPPAFTPKGINLRAQTGPSVFDGGEAAFSELLAPSGMPGEKSSTNRISGTSRCSANDRQMYQ